MRRRTKAESRNQRLHEGEPLWAASISGARCPSRSLWAKRRGGAGTIFLIMRVARRVGEWQRQMVLDLSSGGIAAFCAREKRGAARGGLVTERASLAAAR